MRIGSKIKDYLDENYLKQKYLATRLGISESALSLMLSDKREISLDTYIVIIECLNLPFEYFLRGNEE